MTLPNYLSKQVKKRLYDCKHLTPVAPHFQSIDSKIKIAQAGGLKYNLIPNGGQLKVIICLTLRGSNVGHLTWLV